MKTIYLDEISKRLFIGVLMASGSSICSIYNVYENMRESEQIRKLAITVRLVDPF